jgi:hypothetical protein
VWITVGAVVAALGGFTGLASLVESFRRRGKDRAEEKQVEATAAQVLTDAAARAVETGQGLLKPLQDQITWLVQRDQEREQEIGQLRRRDLTRQREIQTMRRDHKDEIAVRDRLAREHKAWDEAVATEVRSLGRTVPSPPPLLPTKG